MHFILRTSPSEKLEFVISVSKKVSKKAVTRNLIKRRVRPIVRKFKLKPARYLLVAKSGAEEIKGRELETELVKLVKLQSQ